MIDYRKRVNTYMAKAPKRKSRGLPAKSGGIESSLSYQSKFYLVIFLILLSCGLYIFFQILLMNSLDGSGCANGHEYRRLEGTVIRF